MGWRWEHPPYTSVACKLNEHGGEREQQHEQMYGRLAAELDKAIREIAAKPEYAEIVAWVDLPCRRLDLCSIYGP